MKESIRDSPNHIHMPYGKQVVIAILTEEGVAGTGMLKEERYKKKKAKNHAIVKPVHRMHRFSQDNHLPSHLFCCIHPNQATSPEHKEDLFHVRCAIHTSQRAITPNMS